MIIRISWDIYFAPFPGSYPAVFQCCFPFYYFTTLTKIPSPKGNKAAKEKNAGVFSGEENKYKTKS
jgi:hypothetical protein